MNIKDYKWTEKRFGTRFAKILKGLGFSDGNTEDIKVTDANGNVKTLVTDSTFSSLLAKNGLIEVKWQELKDKRDNGQLIPGSLYRITDYQCTTTQENTKSAGHQFDIVLLALSENKLAEEGWAMEHPTDVYDVTFADGITKKCYIYEDTIAGYYYVVDINTLLGVDMDNNPDVGELVINEEAKTAVTNAYSFTDLTKENLTYNYFQNSNLSAWKVWYCLDNDKSRFAWADDRLILHEIMISGSPQDYIRTPESDLTIDGVKYYAWVWSSSPEFTLSETPKHGDAVYGNFGGMQEIGEVDKVFTNGRGVIYRLIDEFNNDVAYDFKNIQFFRKLDNNGHVTNEGTEKWIFTFSLYNVEDDELLDASLNYPKFVTDEGGWHITSNNKICRIYSYDDGNEPLYDTAVNRQYLNDTVFTFAAINYDRAPSVRNNVILTAYDCSFPDVNNLVLLSSVHKNYSTYTSSLNECIIWSDKKCTFQPLS